MRSRGWYRTTTETVAPGGVPGTVVRFWAGRWTEHVGPLPPTVEHSPDATQVIRIPKTKGIQVRKRILAAVAALALLGGAGGIAMTQASAEPAPVAVAALVNPNPVAAGPYHAGNILCNRDNQPMLGVWTHHCPQGWHYRQIAAQDIAGLPSGGGSVGVTGVHTTVVLSADFQDGTPAERTVTIAGLPAYKATWIETMGSNITGPGNRLRLGVPTTVTVSSGDALPAGTTVTITPGRPTVGSTSRRFEVATTGFTGTKTFTLDLWVVPVS